MKLIRPLIIAATALIATAAWSDPPRGHDRYRESRDFEQRDNYRDHREYRDYPDRSQRDSYSRRPIRDVIGEVEHNYRGRVVDVQPPRSEADEDMYRVRVLQEGGRVKTLHVPADRRRER